ncbi:MAG: hypothetical protein CM15mP25_5140 [Gammaproteobacteria bacterium]|nr:MAG: hypothetical protein CM15mP25_5140 [Gammaproteobacteria bacterium]
MPRTSAMPWRLGAREAERFSLMERILRRRHAGCERVVGEVRLGLMMRPLKGVITREIEAGLDHYLAD